MLTDPWFEIRAVVLVEGRSDAAALHALAEREGRDLAAEAIAIASMGGATNIDRFVSAVGPGGRGLELAGLYDAAERPFVARALTRCGLLNGSHKTLADVGFFECVRDLEDELIHALGIARTEAVVESQGELRQLRTFLRQPAQRQRDPFDQLRRFMGTHSGRKTQYATAMVAALELDEMPAPLVGVLSHV